MIRERDSVLPVVAGLGLSDRQCGIEIIDK